MAHQIIPHFSHSMNNICFNFFLYCGLIRFASCIQQRLLSRGLSHADFLLKLYQKMYFPFAIKLGCLSFNSNPPIMSTEHYKGQLLLTVYWDCGLSSYNCVPYGGVESVHDVMVST